MPTFTFTKSLSTGPSEIPQSHILLCPGYLLIAGAAAEAAKRPMKRSRGFGLAARPRVGRPAAALVFLSAASSGIRRNDAMRKRTEERGERRAHRGGRSAMISRSVGRRSKPAGCVTQRRGGEERERFPPLSPDDAPEGGRDVPIIRFA